MSNTQVPGISPTNAPDSTGIVSSLKGATAYLGKLVSSLFGGASQATQTAADYAQKSKKSIDPVINAIGETAKRVSDITLLGAILDRNNRTGLRDAYFTSTKIAKDTKDYQDTGSLRLDKRLNDIRQTPTQILGKLSDPKLLPPERQNTEADTKRNNKKKSKSKRSSFKRHNYKGKIKVANRRK
jgi:ribosomal protein S10